MRNITLLFLSLCIFNCLSIAQDAEDKLPGAPLESERTLAWIYSKINEINKTDDLSGSFLIESANATLFSYAVGKHVHVDTAHNMGHNNLFFPAITLAKLQDMEMLKFSDLVSTYHPDYSSNDTLMISDILNQGSGLGAIENYRVAYEIVGIVAGQDCSDFIQKNIFQVCGMTQSKFEKVSLPDSDYYVDAFRSVTASVSELSRFHRVYYVDALISNKVRMQLLSDTISNKDNFEIKQGLGIDHYRVANKEAYVVQGESDLVNFDYYHFPKTNRTLIMFIDKNEDAYKRMKKILLSLIANN
ncbi:MAG: hypothetical protein HKN22_03280 [Bacteroidia bacterium]|nr:hypothetical protein [Bacteroidia bacterium]